MRSEEQTQESSTLRERRKRARRQADRELLARLDELQETVDRRGGASSDEAARKKRRAVRHNCKVRISMLIGHAAGHSDKWSVDSVKVEGRVLDLSAGGASLFTKQPFETGQQLRLAIKLRDGSKINTNATVRWVKAVPDKGAYASGVQFVEVQRSDEKRINKFLAHLDETAGL